MKRILSKWMLGEDNLFLLDYGKNAKYRYDVAIFHAAHSYVADGVLYHEEDAFDTTGNQFNSVLDAEDFIRSFGFQECSI